MWNLIITINSVILTFISVYFVYSIGASIVLGNWKIFVTGLLLFTFFSLVEIALGAINES